MARSRDSKTDKKSGEQKDSPADTEALREQRPPVVEAERPASTAVSRWSRQTLLQGWVSIAVWMTFGLLIEGLLGYKTPAYLLDNERRELFRLAHTHGTFLGLVLIAAALSTARFSLAPPRPAFAALRLGALVMPFGFLLAGIWHYESDPGLAIWLVPPAALLLIFGVVALALNSFGSLRDKD